MRILVLNTGLFPDADTVTTAVAALAGDHQVAIMDLTQMRDDAAWDDAAEALMTADRVISI